MDSVTIQGIKLHVGDRVYIDGAAPFKSAVYALTFIHPVKKDYVTIRRSPRPGVLCRDGYGQSLSFFKDKVLRRMPRGVQLVEF